MMSLEEMKGDEKKVEYLELIYDLIFVFVIVTIAAINNMYMDIAVSVLFVFIIMWMLDRFWKSKEKSE